MTTQITVTDTPTTHHTPGYVTPDIDGKTLRQALKILRAIDWGNIGTMTITPLSDGTYLSIEQQPAADRGAWLMGSQRVVRSEFIFGATRVIRYYSL